MSNTVCVSTPVTPIRSSAVTRIKRTGSPDSALKGFTDKEREMLLTIYREGDTIPDNIYNLSVALEIKQDILWKLVNELERKVAKRRGLV